MEVFQKNKIIVIAGIVLIVVTGFFAATLFRRTENPAVEQPPVEVQQEEAPVPTVDSSVTVALEPLNGNREVEIIVKNAPKGTVTVDVEMSYETADQSLEGVIGEIKVENGTGTQKFTLGTCSSGTCRYHELASDIQLVLKFNGGYGEQIFEKSYAL